METVDFGIETNTIRYNLPNTSEYNNKYDITFINRNKAVLAYTMNNSLVDQTYLIVNILSFSDITTNPANVDIIATQIITLPTYRFVNICKISDTRVLIVNGPDFYVVNITGDVIELEHSDPAAILRGNVDYVSGLPKEGTQYFQMYSIKTNEVIFGHGEAVPSQTSDTLITKCVYDPILKSFTFTDLKDTGSLSTPGSWTKDPGFIFNITPIEDSSNYFVTFAQTIASSLTAGLMYSAIIDEDGTEIQDITVPNYTDYGFANPITNAVAIKENIILFLSQSNLDHIYFDGTNYTRIIPPIPPISSNNSPQVYSIHPFKNGAYMVLIRDGFVVNRFLDPRVSIFIGFNSFNDVSVGGFTALKYYDDEIIVRVSRATLSNTGPLLSFRVAYAPN